MIDVYSWAQVDNIIYFKSYNKCPGLFMYDLHAEKLSTIDNSLKWNNTGYFRTVTNGKHVVFLPYSSNEFIIYNVNNKTIKTIPKKNNKSMYRSYAIMDGKIYMIPHHDCVLEEIAVFDYASENIEYPFTNNKASFFIDSYGNATVVNQNVYLPLRHDNQILKLNMISGDYEILTIGNRQERYGIIFNIGEKFYLSGEQKYLYEWDGIEYVKEIPLEDKTRGEVVPWKQLFSDAILFDNHIIFSPLNYSSLISLKLDKLEVDYLYEFNNPIRISWGMERLNNDIFMAMTTVKDNDIKQYLISNMNAKICVSERELIKLGEDVDLCKYGFEYSEFALKTFIKKIIEDKKT